MSIVCVSSTLFIYHSHYLYTTHIIYIQLTLLIHYLLDHPHYLYIMHIIYLSQETSGPTPQVASSAAHTGGMYVCSSKLCDVV